VCVDCGHYFTISAKQVKAIKQRNRNLPTHCPMCRSFRWSEERRRTRQIQKYERSCCQ